MQFNWARFVMEIEMLLLPDHTIVLRLNDLTWTSVALETLFVGFLPFCNGKSRIT